MSSLSSKRQKPCPIYPETSSSLFTEALGQVANFLDLLGLVMMSQTCKTWKLCVSKATYLSITHQGLKRGRKRRPKDVSPFWMDLLTSLHAFRQGHIFHLNIGPRIPATLVTYLLSTKQPKHLSIAYNSDTLLTVSAVSSHRLEFLDVTSDITATHHDRTATQNDMSSLFRNVFPRLHTLRLKSEHIKYTPVFKWTQTFPILTSLHLIMKTQDIKIIGSLDLPHLKHFTLCWAPPHGMYDTEEWPTFSTAANHMLCGLESLGLQAPGSALIELLILARPNLRQLVLSGEPGDVGIVDKFEAMQLGPNLESLHFHHVCLDRFDRLPASITRLYSVLFDHVTSPSLEQKTELTMSSTLRDLNLIDAFDFSAFAVKASSEGALATETLSSFLPIKELTLLDSFVRDTGFQVLHHLQQTGCKVFLQNSVIFT